MKVLVNAYACNPRHGSEEGVGWNWVRLIAQFADPWVLVASHHQPEIEDYLQKHAEELRNVRFLYVPHKPWHYQPTPGWRRIEDSVFKPMMNIAYALWLRDAFKLARRLHQTEGFDLTHQLTYVGFRFPGRLWKMNLPFVWGPVGGLENTPWRFLGVLGYRGAVYYAGRNLINSFQRITLRSSRKAFRRAQAVIAATGGIQQEIKRWYGVHSHVICEVGPPDCIAERILCRKPGEPLRLVWSGEHLPGKALPLLLKALAKLPGDLPWRLDILGAGPLSSNWRRLADELGIAGRCNWHGRLARDRALAVMGAGHLFVITSLKDLTSTVLLEALSLGLPVVCPDHCGFSDVVDSSCGRKLPLKSPHGLVRAYSEAIEKLAGDEQQRQMLANGALRRAGVFSWEQKQTELEALYKKALARQPK
ncbi:glycosyltransferase family 4 protein [Thiolapillus sp.]